MPGGPAKCSNALQRSSDDLPARRGECFVCENSADFVHLAGITRTTALRDAHPITSRDLWGRSSRGSPIVPFYERIWKHEDLFAEREASVFSVEKRYVEGDGENLTHVRTLAMLSAGKGRRCLDFPQHLQAYITMVSEGGLQPLPSIA
jgi:hypothetical protein